MVGWFLSFTGLEVLGVTNTLNCVKTSDPWIYCSLEQVNLIGQKSIQSIDYGQQAIIVSRYSDRAGRESQDRIYYSVQLLQTTDFVTRKSPGVPDEIFPACPIGSQPLHLHQMSPGVRLETYDQEERQAAEQLASQINSFIQNKAKQELNRVLRQDTPNSVVLSAIGIICLGPWLTLSSLIIASSFLQLIRANH